MTTNDILVLGDALIDELRWADHVETHVGGAALNVAVGLAVLGDRASLVSPIADDADGRRIAAFLEEHGVELIATPSPRGTMRAVSERVDGEPHYVFNDAAREKRIGFASDVRARIAKADVVVASCIALDRDDEVTALRNAVRAGDARLILDPNPRPDMIGDLDAFRRNLRSLLPDLLLFKAGDDDAAILGYPSLDALADDALAAGTGYVLGTRGAAGAFIRSNDATVTRGIVDLPGEVVDTMGAGDSMAASATHTIAGLGAGNAATLDSALDAAAMGALLDAALRIAAATVRRPGALLRVP